MVKGQMADYLPFIDQDNTVSTLFDNWQTTKANSR
jgi:hypothetical protein